MAKVTAKVVPALPEGIRVMERPVGLDFMQRGNDRWFKAIQALDALDATHCLQIDVTGLSKGKVNSMKTGIKHAGVKIGYKAQIRFATNANVLFVWSNNITKK